MLLLRRNGTDACHFIWLERMKIFGKFQNTGMEVQVRFKSDTECWPGIHFCSLQANGIKFKILKKNASTQAKGKDMDEIFADDRPAGNAKVTMCRRIWCGY